MKIVRFGKVAIFGLTALLTLPLTGAKADTLKFGLSGALSGAGAGWGVAAEWTARQAAKKINESGGIKAGGKTYDVQIVSYDNEYTAAGGAKNGQAFVNKDGVKFVVFSMGSASVSAMQAITDPAKVVVFTIAWSASLRGDAHPLTFASANTGLEVVNVLYPYLVKKHPEAKSGVLVNPNDASGQFLEGLSKDAWQKSGVSVSSSIFYERETVDFTPLVTKIVSLKPDIVDLSGSALATAGQILAELKIQGWNGIKISAPGSSAESIVKTGGDAAEGLYLGMSADFSSNVSTKVQRELNERAIAALGQQLDPVTIGPWDTIFAIKSAIERCGCVDTVKVAETLRSIEFETSYGPTRVGGPSVLTVPIMITQIKGGKAVELDRVPSPFAK